MTDDKNIIYLTGGTGFIGSNLVKSWAYQDQNMLFYIQTRDREKVKKLIYEIQHDPNGSGCGDLGKRIFAVSNFSEVDKDIDVLINLAGASIAEGRWTSTRKRILRDSRIQLTEGLASDIERSGKRIDTIIQCSAVGFYGFSSRKEEPCSETVGVGNGFSAKLCEDWEAASEKLSKVCARLVVMRLGVVIGDGGVLKKLAPIFKMGIGGPIGNGTQAFAWIHLTDVIDGIQFLVENKSLTGVVNFVAPETVSQKEFAKHLGQSLNRPAFMPTPAFVMKLVYGEMAEELLLGGCSVSCSHLVEHGYSFNYPNLSKALN